MDRKRWLRKLPAILFLGVASYFFLRCYVYKAPKHVALPDLHLKQLDGTNIPDSALRGRPVVLNFWAPWCPPCRTEMPGLSNLQTKNPGVTVLGLEDDEDALDQALMLEQSAHLSYTLAAPNEASRSTFGHVAGLPTTLYISRSGNVVHTVTGIVPESVMQTYLKDTKAAD